jgi:hypothetical protein
MRRAVQVGAFSGPGESWGVVRPRRGSNPVRIGVRLNGPSRARRDFRPTVRSPDVATRLRASG